MVRYLAARKGRGLPAHVDIEDLVSCGLLALVAAVDRFDPAKGATFEQYAWTRVTGAIVDELRRQDWASRSTRKLARELERARERWLAVHGTQPSESDLARVLGIDAGVLRDRLDELERASVVSLNAPARGSDGDFALEVGDTLAAGAGGHDPEAATLSAERSRVLRGAIASLSERERHILTLVHLHHMGGAEIGRELGVSESRISQILSGVRSKLRDPVEAYDAVV
jgi:RNA polymerase sigma factor for flagellar operon FliA